MTQQGDGKESRVKLVVRSRLDADRTMLANERTLLAYVRTVLAMFVVGGSLIKFFDSILADAVGWGFIVLGAVIGVVGFDRYRKVRRHINALEDPQDDAENSE